MTAVLVIGHADADGHLIAEQTRRNLARVPNFDVRVVVDPERTQGHKSWTHIERVVEIETADLVVFVDLMFGPMTYAQESDSLVAFTRRFPKKTFLLIDHHPLPERRLAAAGNLHVIYRPDVFDCTLGPRSGMMVVAALCENQRDAVAAVVRPHHDVLAVGMRRAAAPGSTLPGRLLMSLLASSRWDIIYALGQEAVTEHRLVRGRRTSDYLPSGTMLKALAIADGLEKLSIKSSVETLGGSDSGRTLMPFDFDGENYARNSDSSSFENAPAQRRDLEELSTLLEVAALSLTDSPGATFTWTELTAEVREIAGSSVEIDEADLKNVREKANFLIAVRGEGLRLK